MPPNSPLPLPNNRKECDTIALCFWTISEPPPTPPSGLCRCHLTLGQSWQGPPAWAAAQLAPRSSSEDALAPIRDTASGRCLLSPAAFSSRPRSPWAAKGSGSLTIASVRATMMPRLPRTGGPETYQPSMTCPMSRPSTPIGHARGSVVRSMTPTRVGRRGAITGGGQVSRINLPTLPPAICSQKAQRAARVQLVSW